MAAWRRMPRNAVLSVCAGAGALSLKGLENRSRKTTTWSGVSRGLVDSGARGNAHRAPRSNILVRRRSVSRRGSTWPRSC